MIHDQLVDKKTYCPLNNLDALFEGKKPAPYTVCNSSLSEYAVLGKPSCVTAYCQSLLC